MHALRPLRVSLNAQRSSGLATEGMEATEDTEDIDSYMGPIGTSVDPLFLSDFNRFFGDELDLI
jgi:hypothetical protein